MGRGVVPAAQEPQVRRIRDPSIGPVSQMVGVAEAGRHVTTGVGAPLVPRLQEARRDSRTTRVARPSSMGTDSGSSSTRETVASQVSRRALRALRGPASVSTTPLPVCRVSQGMVTSTCGRRREPSPSPCRYRRQISTRASARHCAGVRESAGSSAAGSDRARRAASTVRPLSGSRSPLEVGPWGGPGLRDVQGALPAESIGIGLGPGRVGLPFPGRQHLHRPPASKGPPPPVRGEKPRPGRTAREPTPGLVPAAAPGPRTPPRRRAPSSSRASPAKSGSHRHLTPTDRDWLPRHRHQPGSRGGVSLVPGHPPALGLRQIVGPAGLQPGRLPLHPAQLVGQAPVGQTHRSRQARRLHHRYRIGRHPTYVSARCDKNRPRPGRKDDRAPHE